MDLRFVRHSAWLAPLLAAAWAPACSNDQPPPNVFLTSYIQRTAMQGANCGFGSQTPWLNIGAPTGDDPTRVASGGQSTGGIVSVSCTVHPVGSGFDITLNARIPGLTGGSVTITSPPGKGAIDPTMGGTNISASFQSAGKGNYLSEACTVTYQYMNGPVPRTPAIAPGRIWGHISCPNAENGAVLYMTDGGAQPETCDTEADFLFEFCSQ